MRKNHIFILIIFSMVFIIFIYSLLSGGLKSGITQSNENIKIYNGIIKVVNSLQADYLVLSGRKGGMFTFEINFRNGGGIENIEEYIQVIGFKKIDTQTLVYCNKLSGVRFINRNKKVILEYQVKLPECNSKMIGVALDYEAPSRSLTKPSKSDKYSNKQAEAA